eukprot:90137-Pleurochrysis_carterae.AAC.3
MPCQLIKNAPLTAAENLMKQVDEAGTMVRLLEKDDRYFLVPNFEGDAMLRNSWYVDLLQLPLGQLADMTKLVVACVVLVLVSGMLRKWKLEALEMTSNGMPILNWRTAVPGGHTSTRFASHDPACYAGSPCADLENSELCASTTMLEAQLSTGMLFDSIHNTSNKIYVTLSKTFHIPVRRQTLLAKC